MFTLILVHAIPGFFNRAGEYRALPILWDATAAEALRIARSHINTTHNGVPLYRSIGIQVGNRRNSPVLWVK